MEQRMSLSNGDGKELVVIFDDQTTTEEEAIICAALDRHQKAQRWHASATFWEAESRRLSAVLKSLKVRQSAIFRDEAGLVVAQVGSDPGVIGHP